MNINTKPPNNKIQPQRKTIRLKGYDYSCAGLYFITICTQHRLCLFGQIENGKMMLNNAGQMVNKWWYELQNKFHHIDLHNQITMPNHFHGIIQIKSPAAGAGADLCVCLNKVLIKNDNHESGETGTGHHSDPPLHSIIQWFKTMTTNGYIQGVKNHDWLRFNKKLWQRNYYEHIIRNEISYFHISEYIQTNPIKWQDDKYYAENH